MQIAALGKDLSPIFRSTTQFRLLGELFLEPSQEWSLSDLADRTGSSPSAVSREVDRLARIGLVSSVRRGNLRLVRARMDSPVAEDLRRLLLKSYGPAHVIADLLGELSGVEEARIFGSWAARAAGEAGAPPNDIDLLVIGPVEPMDVYEMARAASRRLSLEVNPVVRTREEWEADETEFARVVRESATVDVTPGTDHA